MTTDLILAPGIDGQEADVVAEAIELQQNVLKEAEGIADVSDSFESSLVTDTIDKINQYIKQMTDSHKEVKAPFLAITRRFDEIKREYIEPLQAAKKRIGQLQAEFELSERKKRDEAEREARRQAKIVMAQADGKALDMLSDQSADNSTLVEDLDAIQNEAKEQLAKIEQEAQSMHSAQKGVRIRTTIKYEIEDETALFAARPDLFSPNESKIKSAIKQTKQIPGLKIWEESVSY